MMGIGKAFFTYQITFATLWIRNEYEPSSRAFFILCGEIIETKVLPLKIPRMTIVETSKSIFFRSYQLIESA